MRLLVVSLGLVVACAPPDYGPATESTVITSNSAGWEGQSNISIVGTSVMFTKSSSQSSNTHTEAIALETVDEIIHALEDYDFLDFEEDHPGCSHTDGGSFSISVSLSAGEATHDFSCDSELNGLRTTISELSGFDAWSAAL